MGPSRHITPNITTDDYRRLLEVRTALRRFLHWSAEQAEAAGLTAAQHQLLLAVRGHPGDEAPTIGEVANHLLLRHHGAVQLVDRADVSRHYEPGVELAVFGSPEEAAELAHRAATDRAWADGLRVAGRARTLAEHTFVHRARDLEDLWTA